MTVSEHAPIDARLEQIADELEPPEQLPNARLAALLPCECAQGRVVVACWQATAPGADVATVETSNLSYEVLPLDANADGGTSASDALALGDALTVIAVSESVYESFEPEHLLELGAMAHAAAGEVLPQRPLLQTLSQGLQAVALELQQRRAGLPTLRGLDELTARIGALQGLWLRLEHDVQHSAPELRHAEAEALQRLLALGRASALGTAVTGVLQRAHQAASSLVADATARSVVR